MQSRTSDTRRSNKDEPTTDNENLRSTYEYAVRENKWLRVLFLPCLFPFSSFLFFSFFFFFLLNSVVPYTTRRLSPPTLISLDSLKDPRPDGFDSYVDMIITFLRPWERKLPEKESLDFGQRFLTKKKKKKERKKERKKESF